MREEFLVFGSPRIEEDEIDEVVSCLRSGWIGTGPRVAAFERLFAKYKGAEHAVAVNSCTAALHLSILAADIGPGDEVITTPMTFCASVNAIIHAGATPVLADVDPLTMNIDPARIAEKITSKTKAILPVHFAGRCCDMDPICALAQKHNLTIIEDCAHAIETEYKGRKAGCFGDFGCFSFYVTKNIITGEGGLIVAKYPKHAARLKVLALHGMSSDAWKRFGDEGYKHYLVTEAGFKYNMMDLQAALGLKQMAKVEAYWKRRAEIWQHYLTALNDLPVTLPAPVEPLTRHGYHLFTLLVDKERTGVSRDEFLGRMTQAKIGVGVHYLSVPEHPYYQERFGWNPDDYPHARDIGRQTVSLPMSAKLRDQDVEDVIRAVRQSLA
ncbi:MAG: DegT/DnrJ/EryC1/StrS family aminotransferase [Desulfovibrionales bacterium]|nr:DegT/DnrJ/EryC1/StrS family aminotransferase [Desulfovibrionales bacterium]